MNCERNREWLALALYGELEADLRGELDLHLATCADCRAFQAELARGLGALAPARAGAPEDDLPAGWTAELERAAAVAASGDRRAAEGLRASRWTLVVASFAAGALLALSLGGSPAERATPHAPSPTSPRSAVATPPWIESATPPPRTTTTGSLSLVASYRELERRR